jgi:hypothetical protein
VDFLRSKEGIGIGLIKKSAGGIMGAVFEEGKTYGF